MGSPGECGLVSFKIRKSSVYFDPVYTHLYSLTGEGSGTPLQYCCLENPMDGRAWWAAVHGIIKLPLHMTTFAVDVNGEGKRALDWELEHVVTSLPTEFATET